MTKRSYAGACVFLIVFFSGTMARADDMSDARAAGKSILSKLEQRKNAEVWQSYVSDWFKERMTEDAFLANMTMVQAQLGGSGVGRKLVQQNRMDRDPKSGYKGDIFSFMFATTFPGAKAYETIVLIREGGAYKISGINYLPNPN